MVHIRIYNVEVTNHCNAKCKYCPQSAMKRKRGFMSMETYKKVLDKQEIDFMELHGFGEPLLHPKIFEFVRMAYGRGLRAQFSTNGLLLNRKVIDRLDEAGLDLLMISIRPFFNAVKKMLMGIREKPPKKMKIKIIYVEYPKEREVLPSGWNVLYVNPHSWSSQVELPFIKRYEGCFNLANRAVTVLWDGRVSNCCHDVDGKHILGTIDDDNLEPKVTDLCRNCEFYGKE